MGLFDKLKSLVSDDKKDTGTIEIIAPLSGEIVNIEDCLLYTSPSPRDTR